MTAREIQIWSGSIEQNTLDEFVSAQFDIHVGARRAIQVYQVNWNINASDIVGQSRNGSYGATLRAENRYNTPKKDIHRWETAIVTIGAVVGVGILPCNESWVAPPSFILADHHLTIGFGSSNLIAAQTFYFQVYFKPVNISDIQAVQLNLM
jgi:hypothetical protein